MAALIETQKVKYDIGLDVDTAFDIMTNLEFLREIRLAAGDKPLEISVSTEGTVTTIRILLESRSGLPAFVDKLLSKRLRIDLTMRWTRDGANQSMTYVAKIGKGDILIDGKATIAPGTSGFSADAIFLVSVDYPLFRRRILKFVADKAKSSMADDFAYAEREIFPRRQRAA